MKPWRFKTEEPATAYSVYDRASDRFLGLIRWDPRYDGVKLVQRWSVVRTITHRKIDGVWLHGEIRFSALTRDAIAQYLRGLFLDDVEYKLTEKRKGLKIL